MFKAWCETRARFAVSLITLGAVLALAVRQAGDGDVWAAVYGDASKTSFVLLAIVLGTGSLRQEHALGTLGFSLALPVARTRMVVARAAVAIAEVCALAGFVALWPLGIAGNSSWHSLLIWSVYGALITCLAQWFACLLASDYLAWLFTFLIVLGYEALIQLTALRDYPACDPLRLMSGSDVAWPSMVVMLGPCAGLIVAASRRTRRLAL